MSKVTAVVLAIAGMLAVGSVAQAGKIIDFDAEDAGSLGLVGSAVDTWTSTGSLTPTATAPGASSRPILDNTIFEQGQKGISFDGINDLLPYSDAGHPTGSPAFTLAIAFKIDEWLGTFAGEGNWSSWYRWGGGGGSAHDKSIMGTGPGVGTHPFRAANGGGVADGFNPLALDTNYAGIIVKQAGSDNVRLYLLMESTSTFGDNDSDVNATYSGGGSALTLSEGRIGQILNVGHNDWAETAFDGWIGRVVLYDEELTGAAFDALVSEMRPYVDIPEPATMALLGIGGLMVLRRRRSA